jgi:two-component system, cell cycle sensor histidine kinase and response regulator CckA
MRVAGESQRAQGGRPRPKERVRHISACLLFLLFTLLPLTAPGETVLRVGVYQNSPTLFIDSSGNAAGLFVDLLEEVASQENWQLTYREGHFHDLLDQLQTGELDLLPALAYSRERETLIDFTFETVIVNWAQLYSPKEHSLTSVLDLAGKIIGVKAGDIHFHALKKMTEAFNINCRFFEAEDYEMVFEMAQANHADFALVNRLYGSKNKRIFGLIETPVIFNPIEMRYGATKGAQIEIIGKLDNALITFKNDQNSIFYKALNRWLVVDPPTSIPRWLIFSLYAGIGITLFLLVTVLLFRRQVYNRTRQLRETNRYLREQIIERQRAQQDLQNYASIVEASSDGMALFDTDHRHILTNSAYLATLGNAQGALSGTPLSAVIGEQFFAEQLAEPITRCLQGQVVTVQSRPHQVLATDRYWNLTLSPFYGGTADPTGYVLNIRDVTEQVELQNRWKNAQKMEAIGMLAGGVAHDLNNILSGLVSYPDMLLIGKTAADPLTKPLQTIKKSGERAAAIVQDLLTLARRGIGTTCPVNLHTVISDFIHSPEHDDMVRKAAGVEYRLMLPPNLPNIQGSAIHLTKLLMNLFTNAVEAMPRGGLLTISATVVSLPRAHSGYELIPAGEYVRLSVSDTGVGMESSELGRVFEPFYSSKVMGRSGTGLGMAVVWGVLKDHNGFVDISSTPGKGSVISGYFPVTEATLPEIEPSDLDRHRGGGEKILVIDDLEEQQSLAAAILETLGYHPETVTTGQEAVHKCRHREYDLVILDMILGGGMDGYATYQEILRFRPGQKAIIASGFSESGRVRETQKLGAGQYIKKPYTVEVLARAIHQELARPSSLYAHACETPVSGR